MNKPAQHRLSHDLLVEVFDSKTEIPRPKRLANHSASASGTRDELTSVSPTVDQPLLATILVRVPQSTEMSLTQSRQLLSLTQLSRTARCETIAPKTRAISGNM